MKDLKTYKLLNVSLIKLELYSILIIDQKNDWNKFLADNFIFYMHLYLKAK